ncbi:MAG: glutaminyl-peptide cyclotransferase [Deltaproteobacteria bacterium]
MALPPKQLVAKRGMTLQPFLLLLSIFFLVPSRLLAGCPSSPLLSALSNVARISSAIQARLPHDPDAFTQGLLFANGLLYESTGRYGASSLRAIDPHTGAIIKNRLLPPFFFGEGLAFVDGKLIQLTWKEGSACVYRTPDFALLQIFPYAGEGWGLTADSRAFYMSDGSPVITIRSLSDFAIKARLQVHAGDRPFSMLNELEMARNALYANIWKQDVILRIDPTNGAVTGYVDTSGLSWPSRPCGKGEMVPNGVAYDSTSDIFYLTGKNWPSIFAVRLSE